MARPDAGTYYGRVRDRFDWRDFRWTAGAAVAAFGWLYCWVWALGHLPFWLAAVLLMSPFWLGGGSVWVLIVVLKRRDRKRLLEQEFRE